MSLKKIDESQYKYLSNMAGGKTSTGGIANAGQQGWAKAQLAKSSYTPALAAVKSQGAVTPVPAVSNPVASTLTAPIVQPESRTNQTLGGIKTAIDSPAFEFKAPTQFSYDQNSDPAYQTAIASARANINQQQLDTNAQLRGSGQGKSSYSEQVANQIGAKEMGRVSTEVLPALINQAYQRYSDQANRDLQVQQANYGVGQDRISNLANLYSLQNQQDFQNPLSEAQTTGQYLPGEARQYIAAISELKRQAETPGITAAQRADLSQQADAYRSALTGLGVDSSLFGANVNANTSTQNLNRVGFQTLEAKNQAFNQDATMAQLTGMLPDGTQTASEKQRIFQNDMVQSQYDEDIRQFGIQSALQRQVQLGNLSIDQARLLLQQDDNDRQWASLDWQMSQPGSTEKDYRGLSASQVLDGIQSRYSEPAFRMDASGNQILDDDGNPKQFGSTITSDPAKRERMFLDVIDSNLPTDTETYQVLTMLGLTKAEIEAFKKKYTGN